MDMQIHVKKANKRRYPRIIFAIIGVFLIGVIGVFSIGVIGYSITAKSTFNLPPLATEKIQNPPTQLAWPEIGAAAIEWDGEIVGFNGDKVLPTASTAKIITVLMILQEKPLSATDNGPTITMTASDEEKWRTAIANGESNEEVHVGQTYTERELLDAIMLVSANNLTKTAAIWAFGDYQTFLKKTNQWLAKNGLLKTHLEDSSGLDPKTVSTAKEMVKIGRIAVDTPTMRAIFSQQTAKFGQQTIHNTNKIMGKDGIFGLKTGHTDKAGACLVFTSEQNGKTVVGVVMNQNDSELYSRVISLNSSYWQ